MNRKPAEPAIQETDELVRRLRHIAAYVSEERPSQQQSTIRAAADRIESLTRARDEVLAALRSVEFGDRGYCPACSGWMASPNGCTLNAHTKDCPVDRALKHSGADKP